MKTTFNNRIIPIIVLMILPFSIIKAQQFTVNGYLKDMQTLWKVKDIPLISNSLIHNRLNFNYYANEYLTIHAGMRNRLTWGDFLKLGDSYAIGSGFNYANIMKADNGYFKMSWNVIDQSPDFILNTTLDRLYLDYSRGNWQVTVGRQRINWGVNLVWNPNDIFNAFSFFDFDYEERPGIDAVRVQYYTSYASSIELVYQMEENFKKMSIAGLYRFNALNYDFQILSGKMRQDLVLGGGWSGDINGAGFRGEGTFFYTPDSAGSAAQQFVGSISLDYMFSNSLYVHTALLYNSKGRTGSFGDINYLLNTDLSPKTLSFARWSLFGQVSYPLSPIVNADLSGMINPIDGSFFLSPSVTWNMAQNVDFSFIGQLFDGASDAEFGNIGHLVNIRFKYSF
ncbi:hypothetical protein [Saccharicrinis sp. FJH54]|uniref:hypothetical protein n=1 Tax=Saccharicrinis sp. FJH54 TaxID=3344665 RepID=UPI0035D460CD